MLPQQAAACSSATLASVSHECLSSHSILPRSRPHRLLSGPVSPLWHPRVLSTCHTHNRHGVSVTVRSLAATPVRTAHRCRLLQAQASKGGDGGLLESEGESDVCSSSSDGTTSTVASSKNLSNKAGAYGHAQFDSSESSDPGTEQLPKSFDSTFRTVRLSSSISTSADRLAAASTDSASQPFMSSSVSEAAVELSGQSMVLPEASSNRLRENEAGQADGLESDGKGVGSSLPTTEAGAAPKDRVKAAMERARSYKNTGQTGQPLGSRRTVKATPVMGFRTQSRTESGTDLGAGSAKALGTGARTLPDAPPSSEDKSKPPQSDVTTSPRLTRVSPGDDGDGQQREQLPGLEISPVPSSTMQNSEVVDEPSSGQAPAAADATLASSATEAKRAGAKLSLAKAAAYLKERSSQGTRTGTKESKTDSQRTEGRSQLRGTEADPVYSPQSTPGPMNDEAGEQARGQQAELESLGEEDKRLPQVDEYGVKLPEVEIITRDGIRRPVFSKKSASYKSPNNGNKARSAAKPAPKPETPQSGGYRLPSSAPSAFEGFVDQNRSRSNSGGYLQQGRAVDSFNMSPPSVLPQVEIITRDAAIANDRASEDSIQDDGLYKPKVSTWGVFPRPKNISEKYGGGRTIKPGEKLISDEEMATKNQRIQQRLAEYRKTMGIDIDPATKASIDKAMSCGLDLMNKGQLQQALCYFDDVISQCVFKSEPYGEAALQRALCLDSLSRREEAKEVYQTLVSHPTATVRRKASQMLFGFQGLGLRVSDSRCSVYVSWDGVHLLLLLCM
ncbi:hypothetical protein CBR_g29393 [Chara braunii]|uniref:Uncharacterized protein n=1 Tax=Chara braunii TaxID=69332 RepID=A0A388JWP1_CHABU|nr:hypothetical protein CBR_g29393 [Chara braunii]|eukprot:GBG62193.1 hypothetical protein CBR_g29393 [Chara braunii]